MLLFSVWMCWTLKSKLLCMWLLQHKLVTLKNQAKKEKLQKKKLLLLFFESTHFIRRNIIDVSVQQHSSVHASFVEVCSCPPFSEALASRLFPGQYAASSFANVIHKQMSLIPLQHDRTCVKLLRLVCVTLWYQLQHNLPDLNLLRLKLSTVRTPPAKRWLLLPWSLS